ncbi:MAG: hypothetical protein ACXABO_04005 [Promethearchaeota archaeon]
MNSESIEKQVKDFLEKSFLAEEYLIDTEIQKRRFALLSKLVADLFKCNNSALCFHNISNLIILILNIYNEKFPIDIYSNDDNYSVRGKDSKIKQILGDNLL